eukprot:s1428_g19.t2
MRCSTCHEHQAPRLARTAVLHQPCDFGTVVSMDAVKWTNSQGQQFLFYHFVDQSTAYQTAVIAPSNNSSAAIQAMLQGWISWAGSPGLLCVDSATELNSEEFSRFLQKYGIPSKTIAPEAHWQNAKAERHGGILQQILNRMDAEETINSYDQLSMALAFATHTKNQWSRHRGYPPELLVLGKATRVAGFVISDSSVASHSYALEESSEGLRFRAELAMRERARRAFAAVDNQEVLRRAPVHRSRPLPSSYNKGDWVMIWKKRGEADGQWQGQAGLTLAAKQSGLSVAPPLDRMYPAFGRSWDLTSVVDQELFWCLYEVLRPSAVHAGLPCEHYSVLGERNPDQGDHAVRSLVIHVLKRQEKENQKGTAETPTNNLLWG